MRCIPPPLGAKLRPTRRMESLPQMFRSALLILSGNLFASLMMLARNLIVARLVSVEDYGIAATFAISMAIVEMMTTLGLQQLIVQETKGNDPKFQDGLQGFHLARSLLAGLVLYLLAGPIAAFLGIPEVAWAYELLALVPVLNGLMHFDNFRMTRQMRYLPSILTVTVPALVSVLLIWPLFQLYGDYRVMLYAVLAQGVMGLVTSHLVAERRYGLSLDMGIVRQAFRFGWPLLLNNIMMFAVFHGEKLIVGRELGMAALAIFAMGFSLTLTPALLIAKTLQSFFLPQLSAAKEDRAAFTHLGLATLQSHLLAGALLVVAVVLLGEPLVRVLLGPKYEPLIALLVWLSIVQGLRVVKGGGSATSLAMAQTENAMAANVARVLFLPLAWYVAATGGELLLVVWIAIAGEFIGVVTAYLLGRLRMALPIGPMVPALAVTGALMVVAGIHSWQGGTGGWSLAILVGLTVVLPLTMRDLLRFLRQRTATKYAD